MKLTSTALHLLCLFSCHSAGSAQRSVWDVILGVSRDFESSENAVKTNVQPALLKTSLKAAHNNGAVFKTSASTTTATPPNRGPTTASTTMGSTTSRGKRKIIVNLMDVYHCPKSGAFP